MNISVCMASYNGSFFIKTQITSILNQLGHDDELIIVDDASSDNTVNIIKNFKSPLIKLYLNKSNLGPACSFGKALYHAKNDLILLSDQDDFWFPNKIFYLRSIFLTSGPDLLVHDAFVINHGSPIKKTLFQINNSRKGILKNIYRNTYTGCCLAMRKKILKKILPISPNIGLFHDAWIGVLAEYYGFKVQFTNIPLINFVRHSSNASSFKKRNLYLIFKDRIFFVFELFRHILLKNIASK